MSGYTPVFKDVFAGSLCGQYPTTAVWLYMLALADMNGIVDASPTYISAVTGMPVDLVKEGIANLEAPDPQSRTSTDEGRRIVPLEDQPWGWKIVNHGKYREKARLRAKAAREVQEGKNAERMKDRRRPPETADDRPSPPETAPTNYKQQGSLPNGKGATASAVPPCPHQQIVDLYHEHLPDCRPVRVWNDRRRGYLRARWREEPERQNLDWWRKFFQYCGRSDFLTGKTNGSSDRPPFVADLEWILRPGNFAKIVEGKYHHD